MSHPLDWGNAAFAEAMKASPVEVTFPRWTDPETGEPFRFFVFPVTVDEQDAITRAATAGGLASHIELVMQRVKTAEGKRVFQSGHRARLRRETLFDDLLDLANLINRALPPPAMDYEAAIKR